MPNDPYFQQQYPPIPYFGAIRPLEACRRAGTTQIIIGVIMALIGSCMAASSRAVLSMQLPPQQEQAMQELESHFHMPRQTLFLVIGGVMLVPGIILAVLGFFVRNGSRIPMIASIVLVSLFLGNSALGLVNSLAGGAGGPQAVVGSVIPIAGFGLLLSWLIGAVRESSRAHRNGTPPPMPGQYGGYPPPPVQPGPYIPPPSATGYGYATQQPNEPGR